MKQFDFVSFTVEQDRIDENRLYVRPESVIAVDPDTDPNYCVIHVSNGSKFRVPHKASEVREFIRETEIGDNA